MVKKCENNVSVEFVTNWWKNQKNKHVIPKIFIIYLLRLSFGALKSLDKNVIIVFLLSVWPLFCITETIQHLFCPDFWENNYIFPIYVIVIFILDR